MSAKKRRREAWNRFGDAGKAVLTGAATLLPDGPGAGPDRASAGACLVAIKLITKGLKLAIPERRPDGEDDESFPSEHAAQCTAAAIIIDREYQGKIGILAYALATIVSLSRIQSKKHHSRDVVAGALIGGAAVWLTTKYNSRANQWRSKLEGRLERKHISA